jgi:phosphotransferase system enzyme I (PtsI)
MERSIIVQVKEGLHARPATRFVKLAKSFRSDIDIGRGGKSASAKSSVKLMLLGVKEGDEVTLRIDGPDETEAMAQLAAYLQNPEAGLENEEAGPDAHPAPASADQMQHEAARHAGTGVGPADGEGPVSGVAALPGAIGGAGASAGTAIGPIFAYFPPEVELRKDDVPAAERTGEKQRLDAAIASVTARMDDMIAGLAPTSPDAQIMRALRELAGDDDLVQRAHATIDEGLDAVSSVLAAGAAIAAEFQGLDDPYLRARADDVTAVARQICLALTGVADIDLSHVPQGSILVAEDIGAFELTRAPLKRLAGIVCGHGGKTSHIAIIARNNGIPAVLGIGKAIDQLRHAREAAIDGKAGKVVADPVPDVAAVFLRQIAEEADERVKLSSFVSHRPVDAAGVPIEVAANLGSLDEVENAKAVGAMGVGLFRTELMFMRHSMLPLEEEQYQTYKALAEAFAPDPVIVRTLDIGGDKPVAGVEFPDEDNPFLGWRGIRMCLDRRDIFKTQLRALLRANSAGNIKVMLPMVSTLDEIRQTKAVIAECEGELTKEGVASRPFALGIMIETPAAVFLAPDLAKEVAFFSIGTNDLTQYIMAADRLNPSVSHLYDVRDPAVMRAIAAVAAAGRDAGIMVGMCGEAAGDCDLVAQFLDMGITEFSMSPASILAVKKAVSERVAQGR